METIYLQNNYGDMFQLPKSPRGLPIDNDLCFDGNFRTSDFVFLESIGIYLNSKEPYGWKKLSQDVDIHRDRSGDALLYVSSGSGKFYYEPKNRESEIEVPIVEGFFLTFNDHRPHGFELISKTCTVMVCGIKNRFNPKNFMNSYLFLGHFD